MINLDYLEEVALGNQEFKAEMLVTFLKNTPDSLKKMHQALNDKAYETVGKIAHQLKTSFSFVGMDEMVCLSKDIQTIGLNGIDVYLLDEKVNALIRGYELGEEEILSALNDLKIK